MSAASIVALTLVFLGLLLTGLSLNVSRLRLRYRVSFGDGGQPALLAAMRAHGNALEQTTLFGLLALAGATLFPTDPLLLGVSCVAFSLARVVHVMAVFSRRLRLRQAAHVATVLTQLLLAGGVAREAVAVPGVLP